MRSEREFIHQLSGPLSVAIMTLEMMIEKESSTERKIELNELLSQLQRISTLMQDRRYELIAKTENQK